MMSHSNSSVNHNKPLNKRFAHLLGNPEHADFWFEIDEEDDGAAGVTRRRIPVHKLIVGAGSHVLHNIVYGANSGFVVAVDHSQVHDISVDDFMEVLRYIYTDQPIITDDNVVAILRTANYFGLDHLQQMCNKHMSDNIRMDSCLVLFAEIYNFIPFDHVAQKCLQLIRLRPQFAAFGQVEWRELDAEVIRLILSSDVIGCDEGTLFAALLVWLEAQRDPSELPTKTGLKAIANGLENCIRWTTLTIPEFEHVVSLEPEFFSENEKTELLLAIQGGTSTQIKRRTFFWIHTRWVRLTNGVRFPSDAVFVSMSSGKSNYLTRSIRTKQLTEYSPYFNCLEIQYEEGGDGSERVVLEVLCGSGYKWVRPENRILPDNMVLARSEGTVVAISSRNVLFELDLSKWTLGVANVGGRDDDRSEDVRILVGTSIESDLSPREIPADAVIGSTPNGPQPNVTYLGRVFLDGDVLPAVIYPAEQLASTPYNTSAHRLSSYTFLRLPFGSFEWIQSSDGREEPRAVEGGRTRYGEELYFGRAMHLGRMEYGKVHPSHGCLYFALNGAELNSRNYEVLVSVV